MTKVRAVSGSRAHSIERFTIKNHLMINHHHNITILESSFKKISYQEATKCFDSKIKKKKWNIILNKRKSMRSRILNTSTNHPVRWW